MENSSGARIPLTEFIASDYLSNNNLQFNEEYKNGLTESVCKDGKELPPPSGKNLRSLNATKLALTLAKAFVKLVLNSTADGEKIDLGSLQLDNYFVRLQLEEEITSNGRTEQLNRHQSVSEEEIAQNKLYGHCCLLSETILASPSHQSQAPHSRFPPLNDSCIGCESFDEGTFPKKSEASHTGAVPPNQALDTPLSPLPDDIFFGHDIFDEGNLPISLKASRNCDALANKERETFFLAPDEITFGCHIFDGRNSPNTAKASRSGDVRPKQTHNNLPSAPDAVSSGYGMFDEGSSPNTLEASLTRSDPPKQALNTLFSPTNAIVLGNRISDEKNSLNSSEASWIVLDIDIHPTSNSSSNHILQDSYALMNALGNVIHAIYSGSSQQTLSLLNQIVESERGKVSNQRSTKLQMLEGNSIFSTLLETGKYPISVCRLLSGMVDLGDDNPITSFDDVIQDLNQMANHPQIFLYDQNNGDQGNDFSPSHLHFGQSCYGRIDELTKLLEVSTRLEQSKSSFSLNNSVAVCHVKGAAGSGKSHVISHYTQFLSFSGWFVMKAKFKRDMEHGSREVISSLFDKMIIDFVSMRNGTNRRDHEYSCQAAKAISDAFDSASLSALANFIPSIEELVPDINTNNVSILTEAEVSHWQLIFLLSKLVGALLGLDRRIMICLDDLQWCGSKTLMCIKEIILYAGQGQQGQLLFVGMYRDDEITDSHPFSSHLASLQSSNDVEVTEIKLSSLSVDDVADMIMSEMRLPRRLVNDLASAVHKKTSGGHALFVSQLLNSLVRDSIIAYSPRKHRFDWDQNKIANLKTMDSVASLIVSNLSSLEVEALLSLRILSCFGVQIPLSLLNYFSGCACIPDRGIEFFLSGLVEGGVIERTDTSILFCHDLIQQQVYENISVKERRQLHLEIGLSIASEISLDSSLSADYLEASVRELKLDDPNDSQTPQMLCAIATNQINFAGPQSISNRLQQLRFAKWNLRAGHDSTERSDFQAALYYFKSGIAFLGDEPWVEDAHQLCHRLHEGAASALFANGDHVLAAQQANAVIDNVSFEDSLVAQYILFRSIDCLGRYAEGVARGLEVLHKLKFDLPSETPSPSSVMAAMTNTATAASAYPFHKIAHSDHTVDSKTRDILKIGESLLVSLFRSASPYMPLVACAMLNYSLQNGVCVESCHAFMTFGYYKILLEKKYEEGRYWGSICLKIFESSAQTVMAIRIECMCTMFLNFWYCPFNDSAVREYKCYERLMALGGIESALHALNFSHIFSFFGGEKLSFLSKSMEKILTLMMKHTKEGAKLALVHKLLIDGLVGKISGFPDFGGIIHDELSLLVDAQLNKNFLLVEAIQGRRFNLAFWMGEYTEAIKCSQIISALPSSKMPKVQLVFHTFFMGLIAFKQYRAGEGEKWFAQGSKILDQMRIWVKNSTSNFENKVFLLEAEHHASLCNIHASKAAYEESVRSARDHGLVHEQALACELYAKFLSSIIETEEAFCWFKCAHACYTHWGAVVKAEQVWKEHNLAMAGGQIGQLANKKHGRGW